MPDNLDDSVHTSLFSDEVITRALKAAMGAYKNSYCDLDGKKDLFARISAERGTELDLSCLFNDRRVASREVADAPGGADLRADWLAGLAAGDLIATLAVPPRLPFAADAEAAGLVLLARADVVQVAGTGLARRCGCAARRSGRCRC